MKHASIVALSASLFAAACGCGGQARTDTSPIPRAPDAGVAAVDAAPPAKVVQLNAPGELVDIEASFVPGYVTIVDFWAEWCGACKVMEEKFMAAIGDEPRVLVRKVDVGDGDTPVAQHYDVGAMLPQIRIYDTHGQLRYALIANQALDAGAKALEVLREDAGGP